MRQAVPSQTSAFNEANDPVEEHSEGTDTEEPGREPSGEPVAELSDGSGD